MNTPEHIALSLPSAEKAPGEILRAQFKAFVGSHCREFFDALPNMIFALNVNRQIVFANHAALNFFHFSSIDQILGMRPGEAVGCVNASVDPEGCGLSRHCRHCAALSALLSAIDGIPDSQKVKMLRRSSSQLEGLDLQVDASPIEVDGKAFVVFAVTDVTHENRRRSMERIFFHDVLNLAGGISGLTELLKDSVPEMYHADMEILHGAMETLVDEILAQRQLVAAETGELVLRVEKHNSMDLFKGIIDVLKNLPAARNRLLTISPNAESFFFQTDARLLHRILLNMIKNALEAVDDGAIITLNSTMEADGMCLSVHNPGVISASVQDDIFRRTFSTKGTSRGLGTYSMLLLAERYLHGAVSFISNAESGTTFFVRLPVGNVAETCTPVS